MSRKRVCIIDCGSNKTQNIIRIVESIDCQVDIWYLYYPEIEFKLKIDTSSLKQMTLLQIKDNEIMQSKFDASFIQKYDYLIFSGGSLIENIQKEIKAFFAQLKNIIIPTLGICFGHQIIGIVNDSNVFNLKEKVIGKQAINITNPNSILRQAAKNPLFEQNHTEAISLPEDFILNANSDTCENEMMTHKSKPIFGVQFHPEVSGELGRSLIKNFLNLP